MKKREYIDRIRTVQSAAIEDEIQQLYERAGEARHGMRNTLVLNWLEMTGLAASLSRIVLTDIPSFEEIEAHKQNEKAFVVFVTGIGGVKRNAAVGPRLMEMTREYIDFERGLIVLRYRDVQGWREPEEVFLSSRGTAISYKAFGNLITEIFRKAKFPKALRGTLRARFLVSCFNNFLDQQDAVGPINYDLLLLKVAAATGHQDSESLRPYLEPALRERRR